MGTLTPEAIRASVIDCILSVAPEADFASLRPGRAWREQFEIDSFDFQNVLAAIEERLGVEFPERDYGRLQEFDALLEYVETKLR
jgi:acyl carrier protein